VFESVTPSVIENLAAVNTVVREEVVQVIDEQLGELHMRTKTSYS
jgi:hypothetical protein